MFSTNYNQILKRIEEIDPVKYGKTRNYIDGSITKLSPYVSRGVISTRKIAQSVLSKGYHPNEIEGFLRQLAWRDYFQRIWFQLGELIDSDIKQSQEDVVVDSGVPKSFIEQNTGIEAIDSAIKELVNYGYLHNHCRMYIASIVCNIGKYHWRSSAKWMYYHLLDADWGSNALSWQWVAGTNSSKKYYANQENINKYTHSKQFDTFLDVEYKDFPKLEIPSVLNTPIDFEGKTNLDEVMEVRIDSKLPFYVYNFYNLDPDWDSAIEANRILLLEPSFFEKYPVSSKTIEFVKELAKNIQGIQIVVEDFQNFFEGMSPEKINYKEHPTNIHYFGIQHDRDWMFPLVTGKYTSFFKYWKECEKHLTQLSTR